MGQGIQILKPVEGMNCDIASKYLKGTQTRYSLNLERSVNINSNGRPGYNSSVNTPAHANRLIDYPQPPGNNIEIFSYASKRTNEVYVFVYNDLLQHHIYRINQNNIIDIILQDPLLNFSVVLRDRVRHAHLYYNHNSFIEQNNKLIRKYLVWCAGNEWQGFLDVETSFSTGGFRVPYFACNDRRQLWQLPTRPSLICPEGVYNPLIDTAKQNMLADNLWQFREKFIYTDARETAWSPISEAFLLTGGGCSVNSDGQQRCIDLRFDAGGPQVEKYVIAYRNCPGALTTDQNPEWFETETIDKYDPCLNSAMPFYQRQIKASLDYDAITNTFGYTFCAEGTCLPIDRKETDRNFIDIPKYSYCATPMENKLQLTNNTWGDDPIDCKELNKITFQPLLRPSPAMCEPTMVKVRVAVIVHNFFNSMNQPVFINENDNDLDNKQKYFGGLRRHTRSWARNRDPKEYHQLFGDMSKESGFTVYVEGSTAFGRTVQYKNIGGVLTEHMVIDFLNDGTRDTESDQLNAVHYYYIQVAEFSVVRGTRGFLRVGGHETPAGENFRNTSTTVMGVMLPGTTYYSTMDVDEGVCDLNAREIYFDTCTEEVNGMVDKTDTPFIVFDLARTDEELDLNPLSPSNFTIAVLGYLSDKNTMPVAGARVGYYNLGDLNFRSAVTDHNGFYFAAFGYGILNPSRDPTVFFVTEGDACLETDETETRGGLSGRYYRNDVTIGIATYEDNWIETVEVPINNAFGYPMAGVTVVIEGAKASVTGADGIARFNLRHWMVDYPADYFRRVVVVQSGVCYITHDGCDPCIEPPPSDPGGVPLPACFDGVPLITYYGYSSLALETFTLEYGYHPGGVYPMAIKLADAAGRETFAQKCGSVMIPTIQTTQSFKFYDIVFSLGLFTAPAEYVRLFILIGANRAFDDFVCWVADKVEFVDSSGTVVTTAGASKILLSIRSLYDNTNIYAFGTNVKYEWVKGDRVEIIANADGSILKKVMQFNIEADYNNMSAALKEGEDRYNKLVIEYNKDLADLEAGCLIKLIRDTACLPAETYYDTCQSIELINGVPKLTVGIVGGWDTYLVRRGIRYDDQTHDFPFPFLHHSPSDFWGDHCISRGRVSFANKYEKRLQFGRNLRLSNTFLENSNYNGLNMYEEEMTKTFSGEQRGDIVKMISMEQLFMLVFERDNAIVNSANEFVRVSPQGQVVALPPDSLLSDAQSKISGNYGCSYEDAGAVITGDGWVFWVDGWNKVPVIHDWQQARDASIHPQEGPQMQSYFKTKLQVAKEIHTGYDPVSYNIYITFFSLLATADSYVHSNHEFVWDANETIAYCVVDGRWPTMYSFTPEGYACFPGNIEGDIFITFRKAKPYIHRIMNNINFNMFFGITADEVFEFIINEVPEKVKSFLAVQQQTDVFFYFDRIISSLGHTSKLPPVWAKKITEGKFDCHFLMDENKDLFTGPQLRGNWLQVRAVRDNSVAYIWNSLDTGKQTLYSEMDRFIARFTYSEQSAYNTNNNG